jgi:RNA polymerase sigma-70 factor (ECF subfamily)
MPGPYEIQAAIAAVHSDASTAAATDWSQIVQLYDLLLAFTPTPVVALNRAIAVGEVDGASPALAILDGLDLDNFHLYHAARADLLQRLHRDDEAVVAYDRALELATNSVERDHLQRRRAELVSP